MGFGKDVKPTSIYSATDASFYSALGMQSHNNDITAKAYDDQARIATQESKRSAQLVARTAREMVDQNSSQYEFSGVKASRGSPIAVAMEIAKRAKQDVNSYLNQGLAQAKYYRTQGYLTRAQGKASLLGQQVQYSMGALGAQVGAIQPNGIGLVAGNMLSSLSNSLFSRAFQGGSAAAPASLGPAGVAPALASGIGSSYSNYYNALGL